MEVRSDDREGGRAALHAGTGEPVAADRLGPSAPVKDSKARKKTSKKSSKQGDPMGKKSRKRKARAKGGANHGKRPNA